MDDPLGDVVIRTLGDLATNAARAVGIDRRPILVMIWMKGCEACQAQKPVVAAFAAAHRDVRVQFAEAEGAGKLYPIGGYPSFALHVYGRADPVIAECVFETEAALREWVSRETQSR